MPAASERRLDAKRLLRGPRVHAVPIFGGPHPLERRPLDAQARRRAARRQLARRQRARSCSATTRPCDFTLRGRYDASVDAASSRAVADFAPVHRRIAAAAQSHPTGGRARREVPSRAPVQAVRCRRNHRRRHGGCRSLPPAARACSRPERQRCPAGCHDGLAWQRLDLRDHPDPWGPVALTPPLASQSASAASVSVAASGMQLNLSWGRPAAVTSPAPMAAGAGLTVNAMMGSALLQQFRPGTAVLGLPGVVPLAP
mgnify:CR=1 FL=1